MSSLSEDDYRASWQIESRIPQKLTSTYFYKHKVAVALLLSGKFVPFKHNGALNRSPTQTMFLQQNFTCF